MRDKIIEYLEKEKSINEDALLAYENSSIPEKDPEAPARRAQDELKDHRRVQRGHHGRDDDQDARARAAQSR